MTPEEKIALSRTLDELARVLGALDMRLLLLEREVFKIKTNGHDE